MLTNKQKTAINEAYEKLEKIAKYNDIEKEHEEADNTIIELLRELGAGKVADFYEKRTAEYWYA